MLRALRPERMSAQGRHRFSVVFIHRLCGKCGIKPCMYMCYMNVCTWTALCSCERTVHSDACVPLNIYIITWTACSIIAARSPSIKAQVSTCNVSVDQWEYTGHMYMRCVDSHSQRRERGMASSGSRFFCLRN